MRQNNRGFIQVEYVESCLKGNDELVGKICIDITTAGSKGLLLLVVLAIYFPAHFVTSQVVTRLLKMLTCLDSTMVT